ncbi:uncharacterized protein LOC110489123 [Oncorhynchus mykiss]|uniref:uncharacterized protein LOC110489123 n=1 Tax=Oncorhynchus mykiss TaxID=8022 RepID=UPI001878FDDA|nr:uncharacterized protein LOC110489123 [Oncorhynchus mykiss]
MSRGCKVLESFGHQVVCVHTTETMHRALPIYLSVFLISSVFAGGSWCANTARARAAALGLDLPRTQFVPYHLRPTRHRSFDPIKTHYENNYGPKEAEFEPILPHNGEIQGDGYPNDWAYGQVFPRGFQPKPSTLNHHGSDLSLADSSVSHFVYTQKGQFVSSHKLNFEQVKNSVPRSNVMVAPSQFEYSEKVDNRGYYKPVVVQPVTSRRTTAQSVVSRHQSRGAVPYGKSILWSWPQ